MALSLPIPLDDDLKAAHNTEGADINFKKYLLLVQLVRNTAKQAQASSTTVATSQAVPTAT